MSMRLRVVARRQLKVKVENFENRLRFYRIGPMVIGLVCSFLAHPAWLACWCRFVVGAELLRGGENYQNYMVTVGARRSGRAWLDFILFSQAFLLCQCALNKKLIG